MPRFVILSHDHPWAHFDFFLEMPHELWSWRLDHFPQAEQSFRLEPSPPHRLHYLHYEGAVSGGRGSVVRVDWGEYHNFVQDETSLSVDLCGRQLNGRLIAEMTDGTWQGQFIPGTTTGPV